MSSRNQTVHRIADSLNGLYERNEALRIARIIVTEFEKISFSQLIADPDAATTYDKYDALTAQLAAGRPVQYVTGHCEFCGLDFEVGEGVLIPRPETEELVGLACSRNDSASRILDLCTGSGCIAVSIAHRLKSQRVEAVDISEKALCYARRNAARAGVDVRFMCGDVLDGMEWLPAGAYDAIVSNPPYIPAGDMPSMHVNVTGYEPHEALFVADDDALVFYRAIADAGRRLLRDGGDLCFEIYERLDAEVCAMLRDKGYREVEMHRDMNMKPRMVCCRK